MNALAGIFPSSRRQCWLRSRAAHDSWGGIAKDILLNQRALAERGEFTQNYIDGESRHQD